MSTLKTDTLSNAAGTKSVPVNTVVDGSAKAWVNFNGTGTVAIRAAFNVSSITDLGIGRYQVNFASAMQDANYAYVFGGKPSADNIAGVKTDYNQTNTASSCYIQTGSAAAVQDFIDVCVSILR